MENLELYSTVILVAANGHWHRGFLQIVRKVSDQQNQHAETTRVSTQLAYTRQAVAVGGYGLYGTIALVTRQWLPTGNHWSTHIASTSSTNNDAKEVAWLFLKEVVRLHRVPESIALDHNTKFMSTFWRELHRLMGTKLLMSTVFHPQTDGTTEWANCSIGQILRMIINDDQKNWADKCPMVEFALTVVSAQ